MTGACSDPQVSGMGLRCQRMSDDSALVPQFRNRLRGEQDAPAGHGANVRLEELSSLTRQGGAEDSSVDEDSAHESRAA